MKKVVAPISGLAVVLLCAHLADAKPGRGKGGGPFEELAGQVDANTAAIQVLESKMTLSDLACDPDEIARFDGTSWVCAPDPTALCDALNRAICVKADQDGDSIRPLTCEPRCDCFTDPLARGSVTACDETGAGIFAATVIETRARCGPVESPLGTVAGCETSSATLCGCQLCGPVPHPCDCSACPDGETCIPFGLIGVCTRSCSSDDDCPLADIALTLNLSGVSPAGSAGVAHCSCSGTECPQRDINSNDGQACLAQIESELGAPCNRLAAPSP